MKKYFILSLVCFSFVAFASEKNSTQLGQVENSRSMNDCNAPQIAGCGPCYKLCIEQNKGDRGAKEVSSSKRPAKTGSSSAAAQ